MMLLVPSLKHRKENGQIDEKFFDSFYLDWPWLYPIKDRNQAS
jgi:hypothetical protein